jgi:hypothetical protein
VPELLALLVRYLYLDRYRPLFLHERNDWLGPDQFVADSAHLSR